jgi:osmotically inducible lipoprotein OsmB
MVVDGSLDRPVEERKDVMQKTALALVAAAGLSLSACAGMSTTEQRMLSGGAGGAAAGAGLGAVTGGDPVTGAVIGGAAGTAGGYFWDRHQRGR